MLSETQSKALLETYGIATPAGGVARTGEEAAEIAERIGYPVVCKVDAEGVAHKSDIGGVVLGLTDAAGVRRAADQILRRTAEAVGAAAVTGVRVERAVDVAAGLELIVGGRNDAAGSLVVVGAGGVLTEILQDARPLLWPFDGADVRRTLSTLQIYPMLLGYRGRPGVDLDALTERIIQIGRLLSDLPEISELDVNPLLCALGSSEITALDGLIRLEPPASSNSVEPS